MRSLDADEFLENNPDWWEKKHKQKISREPLDNLALAWSKEAFCNCETEKIEEHECPFDQDECNCCAWCEKECGKLVEYRSALWCEDTNTEKGVTLDVIYYQQKGYTDSLFYKAFLWTSTGEYYEGTGDTVEKAVECLKGWVRDMPKYKGLLY